MEHVLVEKLVNQRQYPMTIQFELPLDLSMSDEPKVKATVGRLKQALRSDGLLLNGIINEEIQYPVKGSMVEREENFHFSYLISREDLREANLLNFEVEAQIDQHHYHLIKKEGQVFLKQIIKLLIRLSEYHVEDHSIYKIGGLQKESGIFLKKLQEVEQSFLKEYPIQLPADFSLPLKISGHVEAMQCELVEDGSILEFISKVQIEYVTAEQKLSTFFFDKNEYFFFPLSRDLCVPASCIRPKISLTDLSLENQHALMILYRITLPIFQEQAVDYYIGEFKTEPEGLELKRIEVERIGQELLQSQMLEEQVNLRDLGLEKVTALSAEMQALHIEEVQEQLLLNGRLEFSLTYLDLAGRERVHHWVRSVDHMVTVQYVEGIWKGHAEVQVPNWELSRGELHFAVVVDYHLHCRLKDMRSVVTRVPAVLEEVRSERFLVKEEIHESQVSFQGEEKVYLHRYAKEMREIIGQIFEWQVRLVEGGWVVKGRGDLVIYYLVQEGERHFCHPFRFYQFIPTSTANALQTISLYPEIRILDHDLLEDGSVVQARYLVNLQYTVFQELESSIITELRSSDGRARPVFQEGRVVQTLEKRINLNEDWFFPLNRVRGIEDVKIDWSEYRVAIEEEGLVLHGDMEVQVRYRTRLGKEKLKIVQIPVLLNEKLGSEGGVCQQVRAVPMIKGYDYRLTEHPQIELSVALELNYRLIGMVKCFCAETLP